MKTNIQTTIEQQREIYETLARPLLAQLAELHGISIREFAALFGISKSHAEEVLNHKTMPSLELAIRIARYWEVRVEELFGWRIDDDGMRCPLIVIVPGEHGKKLRLLREKKNPIGPDPLVVVRMVSERIDELRKTLRRKG